MCQISYKISLFCMATIVAREKSHTLDTVGLVRAELKGLKWIEKYKTEKIVALISLIWSDIQ
jgi:hypothetical protein